MILALNDTADADDLIEIVEFRERKRIHLRKGSAELLKGERYGS